MFAGRRAPGPASRASGVGRDAVRSAQRAGGRTNRMAVPAGLRLAATTRPGPIWYLTPGTKSPASGARSGSKERHSRAGRNRRGSRLSHACGAAASLPGHNGTQGCRSGSPVDSFCGSKRGGCLGCCSSRRPERSDRAPPPERKLFQSLLAHPRRVSVSRVGQPRANSIPQFPACPRP